MIDTGLGCLAWWEPKEEIIEDDDTATMSNN